MSAQMVVQVDRAVMDYGSSDFTGTVGCCYTLNWPSRAGCPHSFGWRCWLGRAACRYTAFFMEACQVFTCWGKRALHRGMEWLEKA